MNVVGDARVGAYAAQMDHAAHEPGWYKTLRDEHLSGKEPLVIPEAPEEIEVVVPDPASLEVVLPDLENVRPDEEDR